MVRGNSSVLDTELTAEISRLRERSHQENDAIRRGEGSSRFVGARQKAMERHTSSSVAGRDQQGVERWIRSKSACPRQEHLGGLAKLLMIAGFGPAQHRSDRVSHVGGRTAWTGFESFEGFGKIFFVGRLSRVSTEFKQDVATTERTREDRRRFKTR